MVFQMTIVCGCFVQSFYKFILLCVVCLLYLFGVLYVCVFACVRVSVYMTVYLSVSLSVCPPQLYYYLVV